MSPVRIITVGEVARYLAVGVGAVLVGMVAFRLATFDGRGCPFTGASAKTSSPEELESYRVQEIAKRRGSVDTRSHRVFGLQLGQSGRSDVLAHSQKHELTCTEVTPSDLDCKGSNGDYRYRFDDRERLVALDVFRAPSDASQALRRFRRRARELSERIGPPTHASGRADAAYLERPYRRVAHEYRYRNRIAKLSATQLGPSGIRLREQHQWLAPNG